MNDDLISRQALKDNINSWYELLAEFNQPYMTLSHDDIIRKIDSMPSVQPKPNMSVIEDIKAEIENNVEWNFKNHQEDIAQIYSDVLNIIDKHIADMRGAE